MFLNNFNNFTRWLITVILYLFSIATVIYEIPVLAFYSMTHDPHWHSHDFLCMGNCLYEPFIICDIVAASFTTLPSCIIQTNHLKKWNRLDLNPGRQCRRRVTYHSATTPQLVFGSWLYPLRQTFFSPQPILESGNLWPLGSLTGSCKCWKKSYLLISTEIDKSALKVMRLALKREQIF